MFKYAVTLVLVACLTVSLSRLITAGERIPSKKAENLGTAKRVKKDEQNESNSWIDHKKLVGASLSYAGRKKGGVFLWWEDDTWHVRYLIVSSAKIHQCNGTIRVIGGKVSQVVGFQNLEVKGKTRDLGIVNPARTEIKFQFRAKGGEDGFNFKVSNSAKNLVLDFKEDGIARAQRVYIGPDDILPPIGAFELPAKP